MALDASSTGFLDTGQRIRRALTDLSASLAAQLPERVVKFFGRRDETWRVLNSPLVIFFVCSLVLGGAGSMIASYLQTQEIENAKRDEIAALCQELEVRSMFLLNISEIASNLNVDSSSVPFIDLRPFAYGEAGGAYIDPKYRGVGVLGLYNRIEYLSHIDSKRNDDLVNGLSDAQTGRFLPARGAVLLALDALRLVDLRQFELPRKQIPLGGADLDDAFIADHFKDPDDNAAYGVLAPGSLQQLLGRRGRGSGGADLEKALYASYGVRVTYLTKAQVPRLRRAVSEVARASQGSLQSKYLSF